MVIQVIVFSLGLCFIEFLYCRLQSIQCYFYENVICKLFYLCCQDRALTSGLRFFLSALWLQLFVEDSHWQAAKWFQLSSGLFNQSVLTRLFDAVFRDSLSRHLLCLLVIVYSRLISWPTAVSGPSRHCKWILNDPYWTCSVETGLSIAFGLLTGFGLFCESDSLLNTGFWRVSLLSAGDQCDQSAFLPKLCSYAAAYLSVFLGCCVCRVAMW